MNLEERSQHIWITGASTGIGRALCLQLASQGHRIVASARSEEALTQLHREYPDNIDALSMDINDAKAQQEAKHWIEQTYGYIDILIHAAGVCEYVDTQAFDVNLIERVFSTNVIGAIKTLDTALPLLRNNPRTHNNRPYILVISSCIAWLPLPRAEAYGASKAAITHFCEALKADLYHENIDVSMISPGFVKTPMTDANDFKMPMLISAEAAANSIIKQMRTRPWDIHFPKGFTWPLWILSRLPAALRQRITRRLSRKQKTQQNKVTTTS